MSLIEFPSKHQSNEMRSEFWAEYNTEVIAICLDQNEFKQKDLAKHLGVSSAVISRWKSGEPIPSDRKEQLLNLIDGESEEDKFLWITAGSSVRNLVGKIENLKAWYQYIFSESLSTDDEPAYIFTEAGGSDEGKYVVKEFLELCAGIGIIPPPLPDERYLSRYDDVYGDVYDEYGTFHGNQEDLAFYTFIHEFIGDYNALFNWFHATFIEDLTEDVDFEICQEIETLLTSHAFCTSLAQCQAHEQQELNIRVAEVQSLNNLTKETKKHITGLIHSYCSARVNNNLPIKHNYFALLDYAPSYLADAEKLGDDLLLDSCDEAPSILDYISYGERLIIRKLEEIEESIARLSESKPST